MVFLGKKIIRGGFIVSLSKEEKLYIDAYRSMLRIRLFESKVLDLFLKNYIRGPVHLYLGEEAIAVEYARHFKRRLYNQHPSWPRTLYC